MSRVVLFLPKTHPSRLSAVPHQLCQKRKDEGEDGRAAQADDNPHQARRKAEHDHDLEPGPALLCARLARRAKHARHHRVVQEHRARVGRAHRRYAGPRDLARAHGQQDGVHPGARHGRGL